VHPLICVNDDCRIGSPHSPQERIWLCTRRKRYDGYRPSREQDRLRSTRGSSRRVRTASLLPAGRLVWGPGIDTLPGQGTNVHLFLPTAGEASAAIPGEANAAEPAQPSSANILVIDDDQNVGQVTEAMLLDLGHSVSLVASGQAGLDILATSYCFDLLLIDIVMPEMSGIDAVRLARSRHPDLKVLYMSGYADMEVRKRVGADPVISKPFRLYEQDAAIRAALAEAGSPPRRS
jgi:CheY-like chemotaxis protein